MAIFGTLLGIGLVAGVLSGMFGIGGGIIIVPALLFLLKLKEFEAIGTSLAALIPPVGILGAITYYQKGYINPKYAAIVALGLLIGAYFGAQITTSLPAATVRRVYALFLLAISARMLIAGK
jgi:uncharacterized membrane protein YfcA